MTIKIVTDSTCDLPEDIVQQHDISVVPLYINIGTKSYRDGIDMTRQAFYEGLPNFEVFPQTAVPGPEQFLEVYRRLAEEGATEILSIHISHTLSGVVNSARIAAESCKSVNVTVIDSGQLSLGVGLLAQLAAQVAATGESIAQTLAAVKDQIERSYVFAALETTEFLRRSGRISGFQNGIGTFLQVKPLLKMNNGESQSEKIRTTTKALSRLIELAAEIRPLETLALVHTNNPEGALALWEQAKHLFPDISKPILSTVTPVIGAHIGPGAVGFACVSARVP